MSDLVPPYIARLTPYVAGKPVEELERELGITDSIKLASNESALGASPRVIEAIRRTAGNTHRYPDASGFALRSALAARWGIPRSEVALGNGSNELIDLLCRTFAGPTDHAVFGDPSFVCYRLGLTAANVPYTEVPLRERVFFDVDALLAAVRPNTKLLFVANPNNPTGTHLGQRPLDRLVRELPEHVTLVLDEAYAEFADAPDFVSGMALRDRRERLVVLRTFSKAYGLAGLRVGYMVAPPPWVDFVDRVRAPFNVNAIAQVAAQVALDDVEHLHRVIELNQRERQRVTSALAAAGHRCAPSQTNFVLVDVGDSRRTYEALLRHGVIVRPMPPPIGDHVRITFGTPAENDRMLAALAAVTRAA